MSWDALDDSQRARHATNAYYEQKIAELQAERWEDKKKIADLKGAVDRVRDLVAAFESTWPDESVRVETLAYEVRKALSIPE